MDTKTKKHLRKNSEKIDLAIKLFFGILLILSSLPTIRTYINSRTSWAIGYMIGTLIWYIILTKITIKIKNHFLKS